MTNLARDQHRRLDREHAEAQARDGGENVEGSDIYRSRRWRTDSTVSGGRSEPKVLLLLSHKYA